jgi:hypothetical protein
MGGRDEVEIESVAVEEEDEGEDKEEEEEDGDERVFCCRSRSVNLCSMVANVRLLS